MWGEITLLVLPVACKNNSGRFVSIGGTGQRQKKGRGIDERNTQIAFGFTLLGPTMLEKPVLKD